MGDLIVRPDPLHPSVVPIVMPNVNWAGFLPALQKAGILKSTHILDTNGVSKDEFPALTLVLSKMFGMSKDSMIDAIRNAGPLLRHTSTSFLVIAPVDVLTEIMMQIDLKITAKGEVAIFSESLDKWKLACVEGTTAEKTTPCRKLFNIIILWLEQGAFIHLFWGYKKVTQPDGTFMLKLG